ncbi:MAG: hypothetical protein P0S95_03815 [Rhabdochlamydiaceae bacterium]|nr:hypothetical protein [Candidatus Amphrikana amoebophyrae]
MSFRPQNSFAAAPNIVKWILIAMGSLTVLSTQITSFFGIISPHELFGLSSFGLKHGMFWQLITFSFLNAPSERLGFGLLLSLFFNLYILFFVSSSLISTHGLKNFCKLFFGGLVASGATVALTLFLTGSPFVYCSPSTMTFLLLTAWMFIDPERQILVFMIIPLKIKWLTLIFFGGQIFIEFANGHLIHFAGLLTPCVFAWMFALFSWETVSPFTVLNRFERKLLGLKRRTKSFSYAPTTASKIFDFETGEAILDDDSFMDFCLSKISRSGKSSLTIKERLRMRRISKRRMKVNR